MILESLTRFEKIIGLGTLVSFGVSYCGTLSDSRDLLIGGGATGLGGMITLVISHIKKYNQIKGELNSAYEQCRPTVVDEIEEIKDPIERLQARRELYGCDRIRRGS